MRGRRDEAVAVYRRTRTYLVDELGVDPTDALERAYQAVLSAAVPVPVMPAQLPPDVSGFAGRVEHLAHLDTLLANVSDGPSA